MSNRIYYILGLCVAAAILAVGVVCLIIGFQKGVAVVRDFGVIVIIGVFIFL